MVLPARLLGFSVCPIGARSAWVLVNCVWLGFLGWVVSGGLGAVWCGGFSRF